MATLVKILKPQLDAMPIESRIKFRNYIIRAAEDFALEKKSLLTDVSVSGNNVGVKAKLPALIKRLDEATKERGMKTALAKFMGVKLPKVSQWLSGEHEPGGETTLQLLNWVEQQERSK